MSLNIGTLVGYLQLDDSNFNRKADNADRKIQALKLHLDALKRENPKISVEVETQTKRLDELRAKIADLKAKAAEGVDVRVDMTQALIELDRVQTKLREMHNATIKVDVDDTAANAKLDKLKAKVDGIGSMGWLGTSVGALAPTILPFTMAATGGFLALGSAAVTAATGVGVLKGAFTGMGTAISAYQKYLQAMDAAKTPKQRSAAQLALNNSAYGSLGHPGQAFAQTVVAQAIPAAHALRTSAQQTLFPGLTKGLKDLMPLLPHVELMVGSLGHTMGTMAVQAAHALNGPFWKQWTVWMAQTSAKDLPLLGSIFGHTFQGIMSMIERFSPDGESLLKWVDDLATKFDKWTQGQGFTSFMDQVHTDVAATLGVLKPLGPIIMNILKGMPATGVGELHVFGAVLGEIAKLPPGVFQAIGSSLAPMLLAWKGVSMLSGPIATVAGGMATLGGAAGKMGGRLASSKAAMMGFQVGLVGLATSAASSNAAINLIGSTASGALMGFAAGGPIGAAIGGGAGALAGLAEAAFHAHDSMKAAVVDAGQLATSLQGVAGRATDATRALEIQKLASDGSLQKARALGMSPNLIANAALGVPSAQKQAAAIIKAAQDRAHAIENAANQKIQNDPSMYRASGAAIAANKAKYDETDKSLLQLTTDLGANAKAVEAQRQILWASALSSDKYAKSLKTLPAQVRTRVEAMDAAPTIAQIEQLNNQYKLSPKQLKTLLEISGVANVKSALAQVEAAKRQVAQPATVTVTMVTNHLSNFITGKKKALGGFITGPGSGTSDSIPAMLSNGEFVVNASATQRYLPYLQAMNAQHFATGGLAKHKPSTRHLTAAERKRRAQLAAQLAAVKNQISGAQSFAQAFAGNVFSDNLPTTKTVPGKTTQHMLNGVLMTETGADQTVNLSNAQILAEMMGDQKGQLHQAMVLAAQVKKLERMGLSKNIIAQMQAAGPQGLAEIAALASGTRAQVQAFNHMSNQTQAALNAAGAASVGAASANQLKNRAQQIQDIQKAIHGGRPIPVKVVGAHHLRTTGG